MNLLWTDEAWNDYLYWQDKDDEVKKKINNLIESIKRTPFKGIGKPELLKHNKQGYWSRRITQEHRLVYRFEETMIVIVQCRYHYGVSLKKKAKS